MRPWTTTVRAGALVLCLAIAPVAAACDRDDDAASTTSSSETSAPATSTTSTTPTTTAPASTTTAAPTTTTTTTTTTATTTTTTIDVNTLASGSGCTPGVGDLPDGEWFGFVADASAGDIEFDLACWFIGDAAIAATAEDDQESPPPNDYYVRNTNPALRTISVAGGAEVSWLSNVGSPASVTIDYADWLIARDDRGIELQPSVWITIIGGDVAAIEEQYVP